MGVLEDEVRDLIKKRYGGVPKVAALTGISQSTIYSALSHGLRNSSLATVMPLLEILDLDPVWLARGKVVETPSEALGFAEVPLLGTISAGMPAEALINSGTYTIPLSLHVQYPHAFLLRVSGESMNRVLPSGSYALVDPKTEIEVSGKIYAVAIGKNDATVKRVRKLKNGIELLPESTDPTYYPMLINFNDPQCESVYVIGEVVWFCVPNDWLGLQQAQV